MHLPCKTGSTGYRSSCCWFNAAAISLAGWHIGFKFRIVRTTSLGPVKALWRQLYDCTSAQLKVSSVSSVAGSPNSCCASDLACSRRRGYNAAHSWGVFNRPSGHSSCRPLEQIYVEKRRLNVMSCTSRHKVEQ